MSHGISIAEFPPEKQRMDPLLVNLLLLGLTGFGCFIAADLGFLGATLATDLTRISSVILGMFILASGFSVWRSFYLSKQNRILELLRLEHHDDLAYGSVLYLYVGQAASDKRSTSNNEQGNDLLAQVIAQRLRGPHQVGWFCVGLTIKLGLLGTVVGFAIMLSSVNALDALEATDVQYLMQHMTQGMRVAMNTTMVGLVCSSLLGMQYLVLDRFADNLLADIIELNERRPAS